MKKLLLVLLVVAVTGCATMTRGEKVMLAVASASVVGFGIAAMCVDDTDMLTALK